MKPPFQGVTLPSAENPAAIQAQLRFTEGLALHRQGQLVPALAIYRQVLEIEPRHFDALHLSSVIAYQTKELGEALELIDSALEINPTFAPAHYNRGNFLQDLKRLEEALASYEQAMKLKPDYAEAYNNRGNALRNLGRPHQALPSYDRAIELKPGYAEAYYNRGNTLGDLKRFDEALASYDRALELEPGSAEAFNNRGNALKDLLRPEEALASYEQAIRLKPGYAEAHNNRGSALRNLERLDEALASYERAVALKPDHAGAHYNRGVLLQDLKRPEEALLSHERAIALKPDHVEAHNSRGNVLRQLKRLDEAATSYAQAIALKPDHAKACNNRGLALHELDRLEEALASFEQALKIDPNHAEAYNNRGVTLHEMNRLEESLTSLAQALKLKPDFDYLQGKLLLTRMKQCDWLGREGQVAQLVGGIENGERVSPPFPLLALTDSLPLQRKVAEVYARHLYPEKTTLPAMARRVRRGKIRIGYYSADFHHHATAYLMAELFERHDRNRFELVAFSFGPDTRDEMRKRLSAAFDRFVDVRNIPDKDVASLSRDLRIDIAVDLKGFTQDQRLGIFSHRAAPLQVSYIGYPGTMGVDYIDYLIADRTLIPDASRSHYSEKIAYLPDSYQVNDRSRTIADRTYSRQELGLPQAGFVFCCFNNNYKITPATFAGWLRLLGQVDGSVLWLIEDNPAAARNLRREAEAGGVGAERLVFAGRLPLAEHLARHRAADLFLDTLPYNAHTTASDALWAGLPLLTCVGRSFASRVAASLLTAIGLPELVTTTQQQYEALALALATDPERLGRIRRKLESNRLTTPLFDTPLFTRHIEDVFTQMYERLLASLPPDHIFAGDAQDF